MRLNVVVVVVVAALVLVVQEIPEGPHSDDRRWDTSPARGWPPTDATVGNNHMRTRSHSPDSGSSP